MTDMFWCDFFAGWAGGVSGLLVGHPFDTLKVRQQTFQNPSLYVAFRECLKYEGVPGFFKGMFYPLMSAGALNSFFFGTYGVTLNAIHDAKRTFYPNNPEYQKNKIKPTQWDIFWAGCAGGTTQLVVACPVDVAKIQLQCQINGQFSQSGRTLNAAVHTSTQTFAGPYQVLKHIYAKRGLRGWFVGLVPMAWRDVPSYGVYIWAYEYMVELSCDRMKGERPTPAQSVVYGGLAGIISWICVIYFDVVKSRLQADDPDNRKYKGMCDAFKQCYKEGGLKIFTRGTIAVSLRAFPLNGATFLGYEYFVDRCRRNGSII